MSEAASRRTFLGVAGAAGAAALAAGGLAGEAHASEASSEAGDGAQEAGQATAEPSVTYDYDVVICGAGAAGLTAAAIAAERGAKVAVLEKCYYATEGGQGRSYLNTQKGFEAGAREVSAASALDTLFVANDGFGDPAIIHTFVENNPIVGDWLFGIAESTGHTWDDIMVLELCDGDAALVTFDDITTMMQDYATSKGAEFFFATPARHLVRDDDGRVSGVIAENTDTGEVAQFNAAKGVLLATGGISGSPDMIRTYLPDFDPDMLYDPCPNSAMGGEDGDAITMGKEIGAQIGSAPFTAEIHFVADAYPTEDVLFVDGLGQRMPANATMVREDYRANIMSKRPGKVTYRITDDKDGYTETYPAGSAVQPDYSEPLDDYETWDDLAEAFGFDADVLKATIEQWNEAVTSGVDTLYNADVSSSIVIDQPPFHAKKCRGVTYGILGGPVIDSRMRVLDETYRPIPGLYAAGCSSSGMFGHYYSLDWPGSGRAWSEVSGYVAATDMLDA